MIAPILKGRGSLLKPLNNHGTEVQGFQADRKQYTEQKQGTAVYVLHLSDFHLESSSQVQTYRTQLESDLVKDLKVSRLMYLAVSGDIANYSSKEEYEAAFELIDGLVKRFGLDPNRVIIAPGNHDVNWELSKQAYEFTYKTTGAKHPAEGTYIPAGEVGNLIRNDATYDQRFNCFGEHFFKRVYGGRTYPTCYSDQALLIPRPDDSLVFLGLNSAWEIDHHFRDRAGINMNALSHALDQLQDGKYDNWLKIAVFHHPVTGREAMNDDFMQLLAVHGFQIVLHGHVHEAKEGFYKYDDKRGIHIIGAGTFGAPTAGTSAGHPVAVQPADP